MPLAYGNCLPSTVPPLTSAVNMKQGHTPVSARSQAALDAAMIDVLRYETTRPRDTAA